MHITAHLHHSFDLPDDWTSITVVMPSGDALQLETVGPIDAIHTELFNRETSKRFSLAQHPRFFRRGPSEISEGNASLSEL